MVIDLWSGLILIERMSMAADDVSGGWSLRGQKKSLRLFFVWISSMAGSDLFTGIDFSWFYAACLLRGCWYWVECLR